MNFFLQAVAQVLPGIETRSRSESPGSNLLAHIASGTYAMYKQVSLIVEAAWIHKTMRWFQSRLKLPAFTNLWANASAIPAKADHAW